VWPGKGVVGRTGSGRIGYDHTCVWFPVHKTVPCGFEGPKVFDGMPLRATAARHGLAGGEVPLRLVTGLHMIASRGFPRVAGSKGHALRGDDRRGEIGAGAATAAWRWCWCSSQCGNERTWVLWRARGSVHARWLPVGVVVGRDGTSQRGSRRSPARRHGRRRARLPRSVRARARGFTAVCSGCAQGDRGHGVPFSWRPRA
jgi:hypothetical protein